MQRVPSLPGLLSLFCNEATVLQRQVFLFAAQQSRSALADGCSDEQNPAWQRLFRGRRPVFQLSAWVQSDQAATTKKGVAAEHAQVAAAVVESAGHLWTSLLRKISNLWDSGWVGVLFGTRRLYDESPFRIRIAEVPIERALQGFAHKQDGIAAKVLQSELMAFALLRSPNTSEHVMFAGMLPCYLQCLERTTGLNTFSCQKELLDMVANLNEVSHRFKLRVALPCTDRAGSNIVCERLLAEADPGTVVAHTFCEVHKVAAGIKSTLSLLSGHLSGMLACSLATQFSGCTALLRKHLADLIEERLEVRRGQPRAVVYRHAIYDLYLNPEIRTDARDETLRAPNVDLLRRQRAILDAYINGDVDESGVIVHWSVSGASREDVVREMIEYCAPALLPGNCPSFNRSKFHGLCATHNLFGELMFRLYGHSDIQRPSTQPASKAPSAGQATMWGQYASARVVAVTKPGRRGDDDSDEDEWHFTLDEDPDG